MHQKIQLICLPYSGGSGFAFQPLDKYWPKSWAVKTVTYPGRGIRIEEPLVLTIAALVDDIWKQIKDTLEEPYAFFGHSLGSTLAYLLAHKARSEGSLLPSHLFLSGTDGPSVPSKLPSRYLLPKEAFKQELQSYGGISDAILNDASAFDFFEPILRADLQTVETWQYNERKRLDMSATVITGSKEIMTEEEINTWQLEFTKPVTFKQLEGNHFFLFDHPRRFVDLLDREMKRSLKKELLKPFEI